MVSPARGEAVFSTFFSVGAGAVSTVEGTVGWGRAWGWVARAGTSTSSTVPAGMSSGIVS